MVKQSAQPIEETNDQLTIFNSGDLSFDYHIQVDTEYSKNRKFGTDTQGLAFIQVGSAAFISKLLNHLSLIEKEKLLQIIDLFDPLEPFLTVKFPSTFSMLRKFSKPTFNNNDEKSAWRIAEFLGRTTGDIEEKYCVHRYPAYKQPIPDILVLSEYNQFFRKFKSIWPKCISPTSQKIPLTFLRCSYPLTKGANPLLENLLSKENANKELILFTTIDDIRQSDMFIRKGLSWESTAFDIVSALKAQKFSHLQNAGFVVVTINNSGAFLYRNHSDENLRYSLFYKSTEVEESNQVNHTGNMHGLTSGLMTHVVNSMINFIRGKGEVFEYIQKGILTGLEGINNAYNNGLNLENIKQKTKDEFKFCFPVTILFQNSQEKGTETTDFNFTQIPTTLSETDQKTWGITEDQEKPIRELSEEIIIGGATKKILSHIPYSTFDDFIIVGRKELEEYREIKKLMMSYSNRVDQKKPLSIAVLGEPGSGKSHGIEKIASTIFKSDQTILKFNLSQFGNVDSLIEAFHLIRDNAIQGKNIIVFWDEFDSSYENEDFGWVKYFLAPMQDGVFYEGSIIHPIGQAIFVFLSSKYKSMAEIDKIIGEIKTENKRMQKQKTNPISTKLADFKSRLQGNIEIMGINQGEDEDQLKTLNRAVILRSLLEKHCITIFKDENKSEKVSIDPGLIRAFLEIKDYKHGVRSMEAIITMSHIDGKSRYNRSCLPADNQLSLHVDKEEFWKIINEEKMITDCQ